MSDSRNLPRAYAYNTGCFGIFLLSPEGHLYEMTVTIRLDRVEVVGRYPTESEDPCTYIRTFSGYEVYVRHERSVVWDLIDNMMAEL